MVGTWSQPFTNERPKVKEMVPNCRYVVNEMNEETELSFKMGVKFAV